MRTKRVFHAVDSHTEGMPTRVITGGIGVIPGASMAERRVYFRDNLDHIRTLLMTEPRGHSAMSGAILQPPTRPDADFGVLFIEVSGLLPMCGHGTIGVATVLVETGMVEVVEPVTTVRLEVPAGLVEVDVAVEDGMAMSVTLRNVPSYCDRLDAKVSVPGFGEIPYDLAYGGNFYAIVNLDDYGLPFDRAAKNEIIAAGLKTMEAINAADEPVHREDDRIRGCHHVYFAAPGSDAVHSRHAMAIYPGWFDRSPCGTGTSAKMACLAADGKLAEGEIWIQQGILGTRFEGRYTHGTRGILPRITGEAHITARAQLCIDGADPFAWGIGAPDGERQ